MGATNISWKLPKWSKALLPEITISIFRPNCRLHLVQGLNAPWPMPQAPFFKPSFVNVYVACEYVKSRVKFSPTLRFVTQATIWATPLWFGLGPWLGEAPHLKVRLKGHVILPNFRDVNILIYVSLGWLPLAPPPSFFLTLFWINLSWLTKPICIVSLCS